MKLGVCYYPEQWPEALWQQDATRMRELGITHVRIAEFAWAKIEPTLGVFEWGWLDRAIDTLHRAQLSIILCTPTATPPKWLVDTHPDILPIDAAGQPRAFGSRRHYCFSHLGFREHSRRITRAIATRYGKHPAVVAWQTDNEYGCHDTVVSFSKAATTAFRAWLRKRYGEVEALNQAWGNTFWSQSYTHFEAIDPPQGAVTELNPAHRLAWQRFSSDQVAAFNDAQVELIRELSPERPITHNFMGFVTSFDHYKVAKSLDIASWDSYPLGFTQMFFFTPEEKQRWWRSGHPDVPGFHHDLYRNGCMADDGSSKRRWWVMEQQPGPVNWAHWNPCPAAGMVRLWTWEAFAHGAELVSYFRWRQAPFAQEQMHAGLLRPDHSVAPGGDEAAEVAKDLKQLRAALKQDAFATALTAALAVKPRVALVFDYESIWITQIQPQGADWNGTELAFRLYSALRQLGLDVDVVSPSASLANYALIVLAAAVAEHPQLTASLQTASARGASIVLAPRTASKTTEYQIPAALPPGELRRIAGVTALQVESLAPECTIGYTLFGKSQRTTRWREYLRLDSAEAIAEFDDGHAVITRRDNTYYIAAWLTDDGWCDLFERIAEQAGLAPTRLPIGVRTSRAGPLTVVMNFADTRAVWHIPNATCVLGSSDIPPHGVAAWLHP